MFYGVLDTVSATLAYTNAGHNPPFFYKYKSERELLEAGGIVLGILRNMDYSKSEVQLNNNDVVIFYSDGVTEAQNINEELFGEDRLHQTVLEYLRANADSINAQSLLNSIYDAVQRFSSDVSFADDLTIVVLVCTKED
jgi:sigma-B regulation protein RsbU (phosphoserine phosphatase)